MLKAILDRVAPECEYCEERAAWYGSLRCPFCWRHSGYDYE